MERLKKEHGTVYDCLHLRWRRWNDAFQDKMGHTGCSYVSKMIEARNNWAHQAASSNDQAYRVANTAARLPKMVSAAPEAARVDENARDLLHLTPAGYEALNGALVQLLASLAP